MTLGGARGRARAGPGAAPDAGRGAARRAARAARAALGLRGPLPFGRALARSGPLRVARPRSGALRGARPRALSVPRTGPVTFALALAAAVGPWTARAAGQPAPAHTFPVVVFAEASDRAFVEAQLATANTIFAPARTAFSLARLETVRGASPVPDRAARDALAVHVARSRQGEPTEVHVFVTERLVDVDDPTIDRMGVHWRLRRDRRAHYVVLARSALPSTLAHELGHYFGNPHSATPDDVMSYARSGRVTPFFDEAQRRRIRAHAARMIAAGLRVVR